MSRPPVVENLEPQLVHLVRRTSVYGATTEASIAEETPFQHASLDTAPALYGGSKLPAEALCRWYGERYGLDYVILRYPTVYGPGQHAQGLHTRFLVDTYRAIERGEPPRVPGDGSASHDYVYVADVAAANVRAMESEITGEVFNVATGVSTSESEVVRVLLELAGSSLEPVFTASADGPATGPARELSYRIDKVIRLLGWRPEVPLKEGLRRLVGSLMEE
ncbi:MAG: NAD-dependent epimerase/dehydratase family protein [Streptosporangiales bacterium]|nr:NAD-dependent epimerase/dehydratase family protein [Streptosporangiales bacterium]